MTTLNPATENLAPGLQALQPLHGWAFPAWIGLGGQLLAHCGRAYYGDHAHRAQDRACAAAPRSTTPPSTAICIARRASSTCSDWYRNILANPEVEVWLPGDWQRGHAEDVSQDPQRIHLLRQVIIASGVVGPLFGVVPQNGRCRVRSGHQQIPVGAYPPERADERPRGSRRPGMGVGTCRFDCSPVCVLGSDVGGEAVGVSVKSRGVRWGMALRLPDLNLASG